MGIGFIKGIIVVIYNEDHTILHSKGVKMVNIKVLIGEFDRPIG